MRKKAYGLLFLILFILSGCVYNCENRYDDSNFIDDFALQNDLMEYYEGSSIGADIRDDIIDTYYGTVSEKSLIGLDVNVLVGVTQESNIVFYFIPNCVDYEIMHIETNIPSYIFLTMQIENFIIENESESEIINFTQDIRSFFGTTDHDLHNFSAHNDVNIENSKIIFALGYYNNGDDSDVVFVQENNQSEITIFMISNNVYIEIYSDN